ncbi:LapA family protein [Variovorax guangxiensis]|uniref:LapA family protein n=1 Tax=Variovorax guangxiensis TaxID=1775474 RepID=A0A502DZ02_9BURK|nr:LapA family protein [Variovorax guangxiensis]TPG27020.1 LapA family protein [Variovorax ginsengisoli]TPG30748.1 LapA family protein [Variovorax guangxiensis]
MGIRTGVLLFVVLVIAALAALNWGTLATPTLMSLGFMQVTAPLGMIMLGLTVLLGILFIAYVIYLQSSVLLETRRHTKEMQVQRDLADKAEASRFTELRNFLEAQENIHMSRNAERHTALIARVEQLENTLAAHVGQLEDRLDRRATVAVSPVAPVTPTVVTPPPRF